MVLQHLLYQEQLVDFQVQQLQQSVMLQVELDLNQFLQLNIMHQEIILHKTERLLLKITKHLVKSLYANAQAVQVYGGEDAETPDYGKVYISIKAKSGSNLTVATKESIVQVLNHMLLLQ